MARFVSIKRAADEKRQGRRKITDEKRKRYKGKNGSLPDTWTDSKGAAFVILINHASALIRKERLCPRAKQGGRPAEINCGKDRDARQESKAFEKSIVARIV